MITITTQLISGQQVRQISDKYFTCRKNDEGVNGFPEVRGHRIEIVPWLVTFTYCKRVVSKEIDYDNYDVTKEFEEQQSDKVRFDVWVCEATTGLAMWPRDHHGMSLSEMVTALKEMLIERGEEEMHKSVAAHIEEYGLSPRYEEAVQQLEIEEITDGKGAV